MNNYEARINYDPQDSDFKGWIDEESFKHGLIKYGTKAVKLGAVAAGFFSAIGRADNLLVPAFMAYFAADHQDRKNRMKEIAADVNRGYDTAKQEKD